MTKRVLFSVALFALSACSGSVDSPNGQPQDGIDYTGGDDGITAGKYRIGAGGICVTGDGASCFDSIVGVPGGTPTTTEPPITVPPPPDGPQLPPERGGCWVTGIGTFGKGDTRDSFGGNGMTMKDGRVRGEWQHTDHFDQSGTQKNGQNLFHGKVQYIACKRFPELAGPQVPKAIPNYATWGGVGRYNGVDGYFFEVKAFDHAEGGIHRDRYMINIYGPDKKLILHADGQGTMQAPSNKVCEDDASVPAHLAWVKELGCISGGNFQIHPPNAGHPY